MDVTPELFIAHKGQFRLKYNLQKLWLIKTEFIASSFKETLLSVQS